MIIKKCLLIPTFFFICFIPSKEFIASHTAIVEKTLKDYFGQLEILH